MICFRYFRCDFNWKLDERCVIGRGWYFKEKAILHMGEIELHLTHFFLVAGSASDVSHVRWWDRALPLSVAQAWVLPPLFFCVMSLTCAPLLSSVWVWCRLFSAVISLRLLARFVSSPQSGDSWRSKGSDPTGELFLRRIHSRMRRSVSVAPSVLLFSFSIISFLGSSHGVALLIEGARCLFVLICDASIARIWCR
jgi:hypothetical protein